MENDKYDGEVSSTTADVDGTLDAEISEAVCDIEGKRAEMKSWNREIERRKRLRRRNIAVFVPLVTAAACAVIGVIVMKPAVPGIVNPDLPGAVSPDSPALRGGTSYDLALQQADSLISTGDVTAAEELLDSLAERAGYEKTLLDGVLERVDELREKIDSTTSK